MKERIIVVGGYGHVGQMICKELADYYPGKVYAAGRSLVRAEKFSNSTNGKVKPLQLNINEKISPHALDDVKLIIMCLDQTATAFVQLCLEKGIHYVDISAQDSFHSQVEKLQTTASAGHATALLSVGLAPGLTNLLALYANRLMDTLDTVDISIMLGMGDQHGKAAIEWTIDNLGTTYEVIQGGIPTAVVSFTDGKQTDFGTGLGRKIAYRFNFSDQHALPRTLGVPSASTRLCFDSVAVTGLLAWLRASGAFRLLKLKPIQNAVISLFGKSKFGKEMFAVKMDAWGKKGNEDIFIECMIQAKKEAEITAKVATEVAAAVYRSSFPHGIYHIEQLFELEDVLLPIHELVTVEARINGKPLPLPAPKAIVKN
ncbi:saccharopine dehydrogenase family protein [Cohnella abietis]|uniref:Saccharopine dehydrogenase NADP binding domain-containing protein n=1 Tax=Cohnella abietis TaxID=2507935 RepID=A0A3T1DEZ5_9BACL|nr:saccharopine dehydrogenase NADP-binding domain-containing protein [Cohnella abietis]BBI36465.1 hypothetical protein KCTCHS21_58640 [Cohnella abietis]